MKRKRKKARRQTSQDNQLAALAALAAMPALGGRCTLCGGKPTMRGLWILDRKFMAEHGMPINKQRVAVYFLCDSCAADRPAAATRVEKILLSTIREHQVLDLGVQRPLYRRDVN